MTRIQFWISTVAALILSAMLWGQYLAVQANEKLNNELVQSQQIVARARQMEPVLDQIAKRMAKASDHEPQLRLILVKHAMKVTLEVDGKLKNYP